MKFDLVSDLHIDMWDKQFHFDWLNEQKSDTLVIAGDISDHIDMSCEYVVKMQEYYKTVMVIDGNHEHQPRFPSVEESTNDYKVRRNNSDNIEVKYIKTTPGRILLHKGFE